MCTEICSLVRSFEELKGSRAECADQNCGFCKELNKTQFYGRSPYTGGEPHISCVVVILLLCAIFYAFDK